jgi:hypothetical protein
VPHQLAHTSGQNTGALPHNTQEKAAVHDGATALSHAEGPEAKAWIALQSDAHYTSAGREEECGPVSTRLEGSETPQLSPSVVCEQCFGAWVDSLGRPSKLEMQKFRKRGQTMSGAVRRKPSRAATDVRPDRTSILFQMTELRRLRDSRLHGTKGADQRLDESLLRQPPEAETTILEIIENFQWLKDAGLTDQSALQHLEALASGNTSPSLDSDATLRGYVARLTMI